MAVSTVPLSTLPLKQGLKLKKIIPDREAQREASLNTSIKTRIETPCGGSVGIGGESSLNTSIKTRIETPGGQFALGRHKGPLSTLPLKQGLKHVVAGDIGVDLLPLSTLPLKQGLKLKWIFF